MAYYDIAPIRHDVSSSWSVGKNIKIHPVYVLTSWTHKTSANPCTKAISHPYSISGIHIISRLPTYKALCKKLSGKCADKSEKLGAALLQYHWIANDLW